MTGANLKMGDVEDGGVGGSSGCSGRGDGGKGAMERTVAIVRDDSRGAIFEGTPQSWSAIWPVYVLRGRICCVSLTESLRAAAWCVKTMTLFVQVSVSARRKRRYRNCGGVLSVQTMAVIKMWSEGPNTRRRAKR